MKRFLVALVLIGFAPQPIMAQAVLGDTEACAAGATTPAVLDRKSVGRERVLMPV